MKVLKSGLRKLKTYLGRSSAIRRKTTGNENFRETFVRPLYLAERGFVLPKRSC